MADKEFWQEIREQFKSDDAALHASAMWGNKLRTLFAVETIIIKERTVTLLKEGLSDTEIAKKVDRNPKTINRIRQEWLNNKI